MCLSAIGCGLGAGVGVALCKAPKREAGKLLAAALDLPWRARAAAGRI